MNARFRDGQNYSLALKFWANFGSITCLASFYVRTLPTLCSRWQLHLQFLSFRAVSQIERSASEYTWKRSFQSDHPRNVLT